MAPEFPAAAAPDVPRAGMFAIARNRRGVIAAVKAADDARLGRRHLVDIEYKDDQIPIEERHGGR